MGCVHKKKGWRRATTVERAATRGIVLHPDNERVQDTIKDHQQALPVDARALAADLGHHVVHERLPKGLGGFLHPGTGPSGWEIVVNTQNTNPELRRWITLHEIGHWIVEKRCQLAEFEDDEKPPIPFVRNGLDDQSSHEFVVVRDPSNGCFGAGTLDGVSYCHHTQGFGTEMSATQLRDRARFEAMVNYITGYLAIPSRLFLELDYPDQCIANMTGVTLKTVQVQRSTLFEDRDYIEASRSGR